MVKTAFILAGGQGTRLREVVGCLPKPLAEIAGRPFITYLFDQVIEAGVDKIVVGTGYQSHLFPEILGHKYLDTMLIYSKEDEPLGTGGSVKKAMSYIDGDRFLVMNGDSYLNTRLSKFVSWDSKTDFRGSILLTKKKKENRYGNIQLSENHRITSFDEKGSEAQYINAGCYILEKSLFMEFPHSGFSIERQCFPFWIDDGIGGMYAAGKFIDIGTPQSFQEATKYFRGKK